MSSNKPLFITPLELPEDTACRTIRIPNSIYWLGIFNKALLTTIYTWNWEQVYDSHLTVEECTAIAYQIFEEYLITECGCALPGGEPIIRISPEGFFEELIDDTWQPPEGDYELPPVTPRVSGTEPDKICLASLNAANCLKLMYEEVSDSFNTHISYAEAIDAFVIFIAGLIAAALSIAIAAALVFAALVFRAFYETIEFASADYWTSDFDKKLVCVLIDCAVAAGDVITFDFDCFNTKLAAKTDITADPFELLLFGQIQYLLSIIGADGLNLAGATTAITSGDCDCDPDWCYQLDLAAAAGSWTSTGFFGGYTSGQGWTDTYADGGGQGYRGLQIVYDFGTSLALTYLNIQYYHNSTSANYPNDAGQDQIDYWDGSTWQLTSSLQTEFYAASLVDPVSLGGDTSITTNKIRVTLYAGLQNGGNSSDPGGNVRFFQFTFGGLGEEPFGESNCEL